MAICQTHNIQYLSILQKQMTENRPAAGYVTVKRKQTIERREINGKANFIEQAEKFRDKRRLLIWQGVGGSGMDAVTQVRPSIE